MSSVIWSCIKFCFIISLQYFFCLPLSFLAPSIANLSHLLIDTSSTHLLFTCPNYLNFYKIIILKMGNKHIYRSNTPLLYQQDGSAPSTWIDLIIKWNVTSLLWYLISMNNVNYTNWGQSHYIKLNFIKFCVSPNFLEINTI